MPLSASSFQNFHNHELVFLYIEKVKASLNVKNISHYTSKEELVHYVFNPALVGGNLADTITFENFVTLWFMPVNILITFIIESILGWILVKITRAPKNLEENLGNLPIIIIPAICKDKGSPFRDPDVCYKYGMTYSSLSICKDKDSSYFGSLATRVIKHYKLNQRMPLIYVKLYTYQIWLEKRYVGSRHTLEWLNTAGRNVKTGLIASVIISIGSNTYIGKIKN
ncbi:hypothetical protein Ahy_B09g097549 [Arachis hypogaea]|uniref:Uncharacterized protein n=1 Tax=Arachis hypogaea TaxID=3818 RepID=A0A444XPH2_ARAHY|nr:hypothetical protein Ahy_B09g097549 [Arachis hypogaea]